MTISVINKGLIKVQSPYLQEIIEGNPEDYVSIDITSNINCCKNDSGEEVVETAELPLTNTDWYLNLTTPVGLNALLQMLQVQNLISLQIFDIPDSSVDLGYVASECVGENCTMEDFSGYFSPIFQDALNNWFDDIGIATSITVTFNGNTVIFSGIPEGFALYGGQYGEEEPYTFVPASYGSATQTGAFLGSDGLYLTPEFFDLTSLSDGVYKITLKYNKADNSYVQETNCAFVDITIKCKVAKSLNGLITEAREKGTEQLSTMIHLLHYALVNGSNCGCNCAELCQVYKELIELLNSVPQTNDCDC